MNVNDYRTLVVLFEPMQGGNHFANLLSTSPKIQNRIQVDNYTQYLLQQYSTMIDNVHFGVLANVEVTNHNKLIDQIQTAELPMVVCGHVCETYHMFDLIKKQGPVGIINFENFNLLDIVRHRMNITKNVDLLEWAHRSEIISKTFDVDAGDMYNIATNSLFQKDISSLINQLNIDLELNLDLDICQQLHNTWFDRIKHDFKLSSNTSTI